MLSGQVWVRWSKRRRTAGTALLALAVLSALMGMSPANADGRAARHPAFPTAPAAKRVPLEKAKVLKHDPAPKPFRRFDPSGHASLPGAATAKVSLTGSRSRVRAGRSPVFLTGTSSRQVRVTTVDQAAATAAGVHGMLFTLQGSGTVGVDVDDSTFRNAYGGDFASRLRLVQLPACALTTPSAPRCQAQTPVHTAAGSPLSAHIGLPAGPMVLAVTTGTDGPAGDYTATSLSPGGSWSAGGNTGDFTYTYPITVPPAIAGAAPNIDLSYDSATQDARTEGTNDQSSWLGDGWTSSDNYIERTYKSCSDISDSGAPQYDGDECWAGQILTLSLNGTSTPIVYDDATKTLRAVQDDATIKVEDLTGTTNGTKNGEYFRVTENGVQFYFGLNRLPGWSGGEETKSAWTVPVYNAHTGVSACPTGAFADTACALGYRFNLDYVVDPHGNAMAYYYAPETGYYGADMKNAAVGYTRGGTLARIDYGMTSSTIYSGTAPERITFTVSERCIPDAPPGNTCADQQFTVDHPEYWPDVPIDLSCSSGSTNCTTHGPTFWSRKRLTTITTQVQVAGATKQVDRYDLTQSFPDGGDHAATLWLDSVKRTGVDQLGTPNAAPASIGTISFDPPLQLPNRVGTIPGMPRMYHNRISDIHTETGAETVIAYNTPDCSDAPASDPEDPTDAAAVGYASTNSSGCFPVYWTPEGQLKPMLDWFYTHTVKAVTSTDGHDNYQDGSAPKLLTEYTYKGNPGWHYDDNETVKAKNRTWGQFRGYPEVDVTTGDPTVFHYTDGTKVYDQKTLTKAYYFLGMNGDTLPGGKTRSVPALTSQDHTVTVPDDDALAGQVFETDTYTDTGASGTIDKATVTVPKIIGPTASRARTGLPALTAQMVRQAKTLSRQAVSYGWRQTETDTFYNASLGQSTTGMPVQIDDRGEPGTAGNVARCTFTRYLDGSTPAMVVPAEVIVTAQDCTSAGADTSGTLISDVRSSYDGHAFAYNGDGQSNPPLPTNGDITLQQAASAANGATATAFVDQIKTAYDSYGRPTTVTRTPNSTSANGDSLAQPIYTSYTPTSGALPTAVATITQVKPGASCAAVTATSKDCELSTTSLDAARQLPTATTDVAGLLTTQTYDALGRRTAVWLPNKSQAASAPANTVFSYALSNTAPSVVATDRLLDNGTYARIETLYDAMLRPLETQTTGENGSVTVSDTQYDSHSWTVLTNNAYAVAGTPSSTLVSDQISQVSIPDTTVTDHDAMGRVTQATEEHNGAQTWHTRTAYTGDTTTVVPPTGAVPTTTTTDARGQTTELDQYTAAPTMTGSVTAGFTTSGGTRQATTYTYTPAGKQQTVTGTDQSVWNFGYDLLGRQTSQKDPDTGSSSAGYDAAGNQVSTTDARGVELDYTYDLLGRKLGATDKANNGFTFASWTYDTIRIGQPTSSTRYVPGVNGGYTVAVNGYTSLGKPTGSTITLPSVEAPLPISYQTKYAFSINDELVTQQTDPRTQGMPGEVITYAHDTLGAPTETSGIDGYVADTVYSDFGKPSLITIGASTNQAEIVYGYDDQTLRVTERKISRAQAPGPLVDDTNYTYDAAGNPLTSTDQQSETGNIATDAQCYQYDTLDRLAQAWTTNGTCPASGTDPTTATVSSTPGSYWQTYHYDAVGDRTQLVDHSTTGGADTTTTYTNGCTTACNPSGTQPHTLTKTTGGTDPATLVYDADGNLLTRTTTAGTTPGQNLTWDHEGHLAEVDTTGANPTTTTYLYDADGNQLIRRDPGRTTLFAGDTEIVANTSVTPHVLLGAVRTYTHGGAGQAIAVRSSLPGGGADYLFNDPNGTSVLAMDTTTQQLSRQQYKPYGEQRGSPNTTTWPDPTHTYLGQPQDTSTGYTDLGARKYDPALGRFISPDPLLETTDPNQLGGYTYAGDNPIATSDPTGLRTDYTDPVDTTAFASTSDPQNGSTGSGGSSRSSSNNDGSWTLRHNASLRQALSYLQVAHPDFMFWKEFLISGASKKKNGNNGYADIIAYDADVDIWYIWEVKARRGSDAQAAGAEEQGPRDIAWYRSKFLKQDKDADIRPGPAIAQELVQPDPVEPKKVLVTTSATTNGRPSPQYDGVIIYWTRNRREDEANTKAQPSSQEPGALEKGWQYLKDHQLKPFGGVWAPLPIPEPVPVPVP